MVLLACAVVAAQAAAQQEAGDKSVSVYGDVSYVSASGSGYTSGVAYGSIGYFMTRQLELDANVGLNFSESSGAGGGTSVGTQVGGGVIYNFAVERQTAYPYIGFDYLEVISTGSSLGAYRPHGGVRNFLNRNTALVIDAGATMATSAGSTVNPDVRLGLTFVF